MRILWVVGGGVEAVPVIARAKALGFRVVASDWNRDAPGLSLADDSVVVSSYDVAGSVSAVREYRARVRAIDGVIAAGADVPVTVAAIAEDQGLPGICADTAELSADKLRMKMRLEAAGVGVPRYSAVDSVEELQHWIDSASSQAVVLKPVDSRGARGVVKLERGANLSWAFGVAKAESPTGRVMVEEYLQGPQVSTETVLLDGTAVTPGFSDRNYKTVERFAPFMIEDGGEQPSSLAPVDQRAVREVAEEAARALGIRRGTAKGDLVLTEEGPKVIEVAARLSGGWFCTDQVPLATGVDLVGAAIRLAVGDVVEPADVIPRFNRGVAIRYIFPPPGRVVGIEDTGKWISKPWVERMMMFVGVGDVVKWPTDHSKRVGFVIASGESAEMAVRRASQIVASFRLETVDCQLREGC